MLHRDASDCTPFSHRHDRGHGLIEVDCIDDHRASLQMSKVSKRHTHFLQARCVAPFLSTERALISCAGIHIACINSFAMLFTITWNALWERKMGLSLSNIRRISENQSACGTPRGCQIIFGSKVSRNRSNGFRTVIARPDSNLVYATESLPYMQ